MPKGIASAELEEQDELLLEDEESSGAEEEETTLEEESEESEEEGASEEGAEEEEEVLEDEVVISIGDDEVNAPDPEEKKAPRWVQDVRKQNRELKKKLKEQDALIAQSSAPKALEPLGEKPTLENSGFDADDYETRLIEYIGKEKEVKAAASKQVEDQEETQRAFQVKLEEYNEGKTSLKVRDYDEAEQVVLESLSEVQQNVILLTAEKPALLVYAIGKSKDKAKALAKITDPAKLAYELGKFEGQLKVSKRKAASKPEKKLSGGGGSTSKIQSGLDQLREKAASTGDYTAINRYRSKHNL